MKPHRWILVAGLGLATFGASETARADKPPPDPCADHEPGDPCETIDGDPGTCVAEGKELVCVPGGGEGGGGGGGVGGEGQGGGSTTTTGVTTGGGEGGGGDGGGGDGGGDADDGCTVSAVGTRTAAGSLAGLALLGLVSARLATRRRSNVR